jgi:hypothetical protein
MRHTLNLALSVVDCLGDGAGELISVRMALSSDVYSIYLNIPLSVALPDDAPLGWPP